MTPSFPKVGVSGHAGAIHAVGEPSVVVVVAARSPEREAVLVVVAAGHDDRIEVTSPGRFPGLADPTKPMEIDRYARNPRIARVCTDPRITREFGEGIRRMFEDTRMQGLADPIHTQGQPSVRPTLLGVSRIPDDVIGRLPRNAVDTLRVLRSSGASLGTGEVQELTRLARPTVIRHLNALRDEALVTWSGKSTNHPRATWTAVECGPPGVATASRPRACCDQPDACRFGLLCSHVAVLLGGDLPQLVLSKDSTGRGKTVSETTRYRRVASAVAALRIRCTRWARAPRSAV